MCILSLVGSCFSTELPAISAQDYFVANYTPSYVEDPGLSSDALWTSPIFLPAAQLLASNPELLDAVYQTNSTLVYSLNDGESPTAAHASEISD